MRAIAVVLAFAVVLTGGVANAQEEPPGVAPPTTSQVEPAAASAVAAPSQPSAMVQDRLPPSATTRTYVHVFLAFAATFVLLFGYTMSVGRRFNRLEEEVRRLRGGG